MAFTAPITGAPVRAPSNVLPFPAAVPLADRSETRAARKLIEDRIEALIAMLDQIDGDTDLEDGDSDYCLAGDDGCGVFNHPFEGPLWGAEAHAYIGRPLYGLDQSLGPINEDEAYRAYQALIAAQATGGAVRRPRA